MESVEESRQLAGEPPVSVILSEAKNLASRTRFQILRFAQDDEPPLHGLVLWRRLQSGLGLIGEIS
jgi:hypothetical protein